MILLGVDPSLRNLGLAIADYCTLRREIVGIERIQLITTEAQDKKGKDKVKRNADDFKSAQIIREAMMRWVNIADTVLVEMPVGSQSARASWCLGAVLGVLTNIKVPMVQVQPSQTKMVVGKNADKKEIIEWATTKYPDLPWLRHRGRIKNENEHIADAIAVIHVGTQLPEFVKLLDRFDELEGMSEEVSQ